MHRPVRGVSLIDVIVGSFLVLVVFLTLFGLLRASIAVSSVAKARATATSIATSQMEYVRSLSYDAVGTVGGIPQGTIPQFATSTIHGMTFVTRTFIGYVDDPADGEGGADVTGITTDYKQVKVAVTYMANGREREVALVSNVVPPGLETSTGGGTLKVDVVNASGQPVPGASVRIVNSNLSPSVDVTTFSNALGIVYLPGAATSSEYQVSVTKSGYSTAATYARDATNQNPTPGYLTVAKDQTTTGTFAIDALATLALGTFSPVEQATTTDALDDMSYIGSLSGTAVGGGALSLAGAPGTYPLTGSARSIAISPEYLSEWGIITAQGSVPPGTSMRMRVLDGSGALLPEAVLPGNSTGFTSVPISLANVSAASYPSLILSLELTTNSASVTPQVLSWSMSYEVGPVPLPDVSFSLRGAKTVGSTGAGAPIYKTQVSEATDEEGEAELTLEWDVYTFTASGFDVVDACGAPPYTLAPGSAFESRLMLDTGTTNMLLVSVRDSAGVAVADADVTLSRGGYTKTVRTSSCGGAYFGGISAATDYAVAVAKNGYAALSFTNVPVSGKTFYAASFE